MPKKFLGRDLNFGFWLMMGGFAAAVIFIIILFAAG